MPQPESDEMQPNIESNAQMWEPEEVAIQI